MLKTCSRSIKSTNITLELRYQHNNPKFLGLLTESLENYFKLLMYDNKGNI